MLGGTIKYTNKQVVAHTKMQRISLSLVRRCESRTFVDSIQFFFLSFQRESALARKVSPVNLSKHYSILKEKEVKGILTKLSLVIWVSVHKKMTSPGYKTHLLALN